MIVNPEDYEWAYNQLDEADRDRFEKLYSSMNQDIYGKMGEWQYFLRIRHQLLVTLFERDSRNPDRSEHSKNVFSRDNALNADSLEEFSEWIFRTTDERIRLLFKQVYPITHKRILEKLELRSTYLDLLKKRNHIILDLTQEVSLYKQYKDAERAGQGGPFDSEEQSWYSDAENGSSGDSHDPDNPK